MFEERWCQSLRHNRVCIRALIFEVIFLAADTSYVLLILVTSLKHEKSEMIGARTLHVQRITFRVVHHSIHDSTLTMVCVRIENPTQESHSVQTSRFETDRTDVTVWAQACPMRMLRICVYDECEMLI